MFLRPISATGIQAEEERGGVSLRRTTSATSVRIQNLLSITFESRTSQPLLVSNASRNKNLEIIYHLVKAHFLFSTLCKYIHCLIFNSDEDEAQMSYVRYCMLRCQALRYSHRELEICKSK